MVAARCERTDPRGCARPWPTSWPPSTRPTWPRRGCCPRPSRPGCRCSRPRADRGRRRGPQPARDRDRRAVPGPGRPGGRGGRGGRRAGLGLRFFDPVVLPVLGLVAEADGPAPEEVRRVLGVGTYLYHLVVEPGSQLTPHHATHAGTGLASAHAAAARELETIRARAPAARSWSTSSPGPPPPAWSAPRPSWPASSPPATRPSPPPPTPPPSAPPWSRPWGQPPGYPPEGPQNRAG